MGVQQVSAGHVQQRMPGVMAVVLAMGMAFVHVVGMTRGFQAGMPAPGSVLMRMGGMNRMVPGSHCSCLL